MLKIGLPVLAVVSLAMASAAFAAGDCAGDLQNLSRSARAALKGINELVVSAHGKKLDPDAFCARSRPLNAAEDAMLAYMIKNKDWCQIPDDAIGQLKATHAKSVAFGGKACTVAAQIKKMKSQAAQAAQQGGGRWPAGRAAAAGRAALSGAERRASSRTRSPRAWSSGSRRPSPFPSSNSRAGTARSAGSCCSRPAGGRRALAGVAAHRGPDLWHLALFLIGAIAMRGAGCTYNDILDRDLDAGVERTRGRPLPSGRATAKAAAAFMVAQSLVGLAVLVVLQPLHDLAGPRLAAGRRGLSADEAGHLLAAGGAGAGVLLGRAGRLERRRSRAWIGRRSRFTRAAWCWTVGYDTIYAQQDARDDAIVGIRSTARLFGARARLAVAAFYAATAALTQAAILGAGGGRLGGDRLARVCGASGLAGRCASTARARRRR